VPDGYTVNAMQSAGQRVFVVVAPSGSHLYSFTDAREAEDEALILNEVAATEAFHVSKRRHARWLRTIGVSTHLPC
jgi:hypothetical protein